MTSFHQFFNDPSIVKKNPGKILGIIKDDELLFYVLPCDQVNKNQVNHNKIISKSFYEITNEWLLQKSKLWTEAHLFEVKRRLSKDVLPIFGNKDISEISSQDILELIRKIESRKKYDLAHRILRDLQSIYRYAISIEAAKFNYAEPIKDALIPHVLQNQKTIKKDELEELLLKLSIFTFKEGKILNFAFQLLALTFVRAQEIMGARWNEINLAEKIWIIPKERMKKRKEHVVPLSEQSCYILEKIQRDFFHPEYVFFDPFSQRNIKQERLINSLYKMGYKGKMSAHGFRALASSILNEEGFNPDVIERQLAHVDSNSVRRAYNRAEYFEDRKIMMQWWGNYLAKNSLLFDQGIQMKLEM